MTDMMQWSQTSNPDNAISHLTWPEPSYMYLERVPQGWLTDSELEKGIQLGKLDGSTNFSNWERGRAFCEAFELRWEKVDEAFHLVYVGRPATMEAFTLATETLEGCHTNEVTYYLWGTRVTGNNLDLIGAASREGTAPFVESKVSHVLYYPVSASDKGQRLQLKLLEYVEPPTGRIITYRFQGVEEAAG